MKRRAFFGGLFSAILASVGFGHTTPRRIVDRDAVIASLLFQLWSENDRYRSTDSAGNPTALIADCPENWGYNVALTRTRRGVRVTLHRK